jgi:hypothetical protein
LLLFLDVVQMTHSGSHHRTREAANPNVMQGSRSTARTR